MLVGAMNPCPCGHAMDPDQERCRCTIIGKENYLRRISGPILDRFDLHIEAAALKPEELSAGPAGVSSAEIRASVERARAVQRKRGVHCNAQLRGRALREICNATEKARGALNGFIGLYGLSARSHDRILKLARTIADIEGSERVHEEQIDEASQLRCLDKPITGRDPRTELQLARERATRRRHGAQPMEGA
jgi:magnesium chelatase family protein